jgi:F0F1-type ATP synthase assembly protein I
MKPENERESAEVRGVPSDVETEDEKDDGVRVPPLPDLPHPPVVDYTRPALKRGQYAARPDEHIGVSEEQNKINVAARMGSGLSAGITFASSVVVSLLIGQWIDHRFEPHSSTPWATIVMAFVGFAAGFVTFVRISSVADRNIKRRE